MITVDEIAKKANVSKTAVSFALNNKAGIGEDTRNRILKIAREEGYFDKPNTKNNQSRNILLLMCSRSNITTLDRSTAPFYSELIGEVEKSANEFNYNVLLKSLKIEDGKEIAQAFSSLLEDTAGVLVIATDLLPDDVQLFTSLCPNIIFLDSLFPTTKTNCVVMDNYMGAYTASKHLINLGHRNIGYIQSCNRIFNFESRKSGFMQALSDYGIYFNVQNLYSATTIIKKAKNELINIIDIDNIPTAFFAENDYIAIGLLEALSELDINVPEDVSVIGFDDIELASFVSPKLTTIRVYKDQMAYIAVKRLVEEVSERNITTKEIVSVKLIERTSTLALD